MPTSAISASPTMTPATMPPIAPPLRPEDAAAPAVGVVEEWPVSTAPAAPTVGVPLPLPRVMLGMTWVCAFEILVDDEEREAEEEEEERDVVLVDKELTAGDPPLTLRVIEGLTVDTICELCTGRFPGPQAGALPPAAMKHISPGRQQ